MFTTEENITELAETRWATAHSARLAQLMTSLVGHLHAFAREVALTEDEWMRAIEWLTATGQISDRKRQEFILASDVLGLSMLVVQLNERSAPGATPSTVLGPFHIDDSPPLENGGDMSDGVPGVPLYVQGFVCDLDRRPLAGVILDVWQADADGNYETQLDLPFDEARLRAKFSTDEDGRYLIRTIAPRGYSIPMDGTVGELMRETDISHFRPAHVHFLIDHPGYERLITHLFEEGAEFLDSDVVFGTKEALVVSFERHESGMTPVGFFSDEPFVTAAYDFILQPSVGLSG